MSGPLYEEFVNCIKQSIRIKYSNGAFSDDVKILYSWKHTMDWTTIHAICTFGNSLIIAGAETKGSKFTNIYELATFGGFASNFDFTKLVTNAIAFKSTKCMSYVISFNSEIFIFTVADGIATHIPSHLTSSSKFTSQNCTMRLPGSVTILDAQPIDILSRIQNTIMYFWVGYNSAVVDLISFRIDKEDLKWYRSIIRHPSGLIRFQSLLTFPLSLPYLNLHKTVSAKLIQIEVFDTALGIATFAGFTFLDEGGDECGPIISVIPVDTRVILKMCEKVSPIMKFDLHFLPPYSESYHLLRTI